MTKLEMFKAGTGIVTSVGVLKIVSGLGAFVPPRNVIERVTILCGTLVIASAVAEMSRTHLNKKIDEAVNWLSENATD